MAGGNKSVDEILGLVKDSSYAVVQSARILIAPQDLIERHASLEADIEAARRHSMGLDSDVPRLAEELVELEEELDDHFVTFRFRALPKKRYADLLAAHPPTKEQVKADARTPFNPETFPAALIAACCIDPELTAEQVDVLENGVDGNGGLNEAQFNTLFNTAVAVNLGGLRAPASVAAGALRHLNARSAEQPTGSASREVDSLDG